MNDDEVSRQAELASAYLDGKLDAAERTSISTDPQAMALVDSFTRVRDVLRDVDPVPEAVKAGAVSAALAQFDAMHATASTPAFTPAKVTVMRMRWQRAYRVLGGVAAAAAATLVVIIGVAALGSGSDSKSSSSATEAPVAVNDAAGTPELKAAAPAATEAPAGTAAPGAGGMAIESAPASLPAVDTPADLARYAANIADSAPSDTAFDRTAAPTAAVPSPASPPASCLTPADTLLGSISVLGSPAFAVRDTTTGIVRAVAADDCHVLFSVAAP